MVTTVVFDADYTLVDLDPALHSAHAAVLAELERCGCPPGALTLAQLRADEAWSFAEYKGRPTERVRRLAFERSLARVGWETELDRIVELFFAHRFAATRCYPEVRPVLSQLRSSYVLGFGTNGNNRADRLGLDGVFRFTVHAHVGGVPAKPAGGFFDAVVTAAGAPPGSIVHVGDDFANDVAGAAAAGLRTVWLNRAGATRPADAPPPTAEIRSLPELPAALHRIGAGG